MSAITHMAFYLQKQYNECFNIILSWKLLNSCLSFLAHKYRNYNRLLGLTSQFYEKMMGMNIYTCQEAMKSTLPPAIFGTGKERVKWV